MLVLIGFGILGVLFYCFMTFREGPLAETKAGEFGVCLTCFITLALFYLMISVPLAEVFVQLEHKKIYEKKLISLNDVSGVDGNFFLGSGSVNGTMNYVYYFKEENGYKMNVVGYDNAIIKHTTKQPKVVFMEQYQSDAFVNHFFVSKVHYGHRYVFHVPKGTVKSDYKLNAQ